MLLTIQWTRLLSSISVLNRLLFAVRSLSVLWQLSTFLISNSALDLPWSYGDTWRIHRKLLHQILCVTSCSRHRRSRIGGGEIHKTHTVATRFVHPHAYDGRHLDSYCSSFSCRPVCLEVKDKIENTLTSPRSSSHSIPRKCS